jgi:hypothetical protein
MVDFKKTFGSRREVYNGTAEKTTGGLFKKDLFKNKNGRIVSKKKHFTAKKEKRLEKFGFFTEKGKFGHISKEDKIKKKKKTRKM